MVLAIICGAIIIFAAISAANDLSGGTFMSKEAARDAKSMPANILMVGLIVGGTLAVAGVIYGLLLCAAAEGIQRRRAIEDNTVPVG